MKGIILAGGSGSRLYPLTKVISKQLLPVYNKPMIYYPLSVLMLSGIHDILIISSENQHELFKGLFGDGSDFGLKIEYKIQKKPNGLAEAFIIGKDFIGSDNVCLILGDNIFYGHGLTEKLERAKNQTKEGISSIFAFHVSNPRDYGIVDFDSSFNITSLEEKPLKPKSNYAITGIYFYPNNVIHKVLKIKYSKRNELEITDLNKEYLNIGMLKVELLGRGFSWFDAGTFKSLLEASNFVRSIEKRQALQIGAIEEIAYNEGLINKDIFIKHIRNIKNPSYKKYLKNIAYAD